MAQKQSNRRGRKDRRSASVDTGPLDRLLGFHIRVAMMSMRRSFFRIVTKGDVHPGLASLLLLIRANSDASQVELARALRVNKATLVGLLNRAESEGWLERHRSDRDRRRHVIHLTPQGHSLVGRLDRQMQRHEQRYLDLFTEEELTELVGYLRRIYDR